MVGLNGSAGDECIGSFGQSVGDDEFQFSGFITAACKAKKIIPFNDNIRTAKFC
jgi:hypothetical protein